MLEDTCAHIVTTLKSRIVVKIQEVEKYIADISIKDPCFMYIAFINKKQTGYLAKAMVLFENISCY